MIKTRFPHLDKKWVFPAEPTIPDILAKTLSLPPIIQEAMVRRGITDPETAMRFLDYRKYQPTPGYQMPGLEKGVERVNQAIKKKERIGVWGDFDVDGQTSTALLVSTLRKLNADLLYHLPVRGRESHGIGLEHLKQFLGQGIQVLITCDTGVTAHESIAYAQSQGVDVVVTDHHILPDQLPQAYTVINPRLLPISHPLASLPGVGTAFKFAEALLSTNGKLDEVTELHDLVALGSIADLAELKADTRYLVQSGLDLIRTAPRPALAAIMAANDIKPEGISEELVSFIIAPRLNAMGRLSDANPMVEFLLSTSSDFLSVTVNQLEGMNARRKLLCDQVLAGALSQIERDKSLLEDPVLILTHAEWPAGVVGIAASRLVEVFHRPVVLLTSLQGQTIRGSARSIEGVDITAAISSCREDLFSFGGHPMAAGLALDPEKLSSFRRKLIKAINDLQTGTIEPQSLTIDVIRQPSNLSLEEVKFLDALAPYGLGNPPLVFAASNMHITETNPVGKNNDHLQVIVEDPSGSISKMVWWHGQGLRLPEGEFELAFSARSSTYRGEDQVQLEWVDYREIQEAINLRTKRKSNPIDLVDLRRSATLLSKVSEVINHNDAVIWKEGTDAAGIHGENRYSLKECTSLVLWTVPPSLEVLKQILNQVKPEKVYWCQVAPNEHELAGFLITLSQLVKTGVASGQFDCDLKDLVAATASTEEMVLLGIRWLAASGKINYEKSQNGLVSIRPGGQENAAENISLRQSLTMRFEELKAFQNYLSRTSLESLLHELRQF